MLSQMTSIHHDPIRHSAGRRSSPSQRRNLSRAALPLLLAGALALPAAQGLRAQPAPQRQGRQIRIMEKVIDQVLVGSQHALVTGSPNCRGLRLQGYGVLFVVDLSPIGLDGPFHFKFKDDGTYDIIQDEDDEDRQRIEGRQRTVGRRDVPEPPEPSDPDDESDIEYEDEKEEKDREKEELRREKLEQWARELESEADETGARNPKREAALVLVREELVQVLRDYGRTISGVGPEDYVAIAIFPSDLDWRGPDTRTLIQVRRRSIDAYDNGNLTAEAFAKLVEVVTQ
jgi:hypothetical protein